MITPAHRVGWIGGALIAAILVGCGSVVPASSPAAPTSLATGTIQPGPSLTPVPGGPSAPAPTSVEAGEFQLPDPVCPAPAVALSAPDVLVAAGAGDPVIATPGSSTLTTCSTTGASDTVGDDPTAIVTATPGEHLTLTVPAGWSILAYEGFDRPAVGEGANVTPLVVLPTPGPSIELPVPGRSGRSVVGVSLSIVSAGGQVVGHVEALFQVVVD